MSEMLRQYFDGVEDNRVLDFSLSRVFHHFQNKGFLAISPFKANSEKDPAIDAENNRRWKSLISGLKNIGYGWYQAWGQYVYENGVVARERTVIIPNEPYQEGVEDLFSIAVDLMKKYDQESILWVEDGVANLVYSAGKTEMLQKFTAQNVAYYMTILKQKQGVPIQHFSFEDRVKQPDNSIEAMLYDKLHVCYAIVESKEGEFVRLAHFGKW